MTALSATAEPGAVIEHADALDWLAAREPDSATAIIYDSPVSGGLADTRPGRRRRRVGVRAAVVPVTDHVAAPVRSAPAAS